jgi:hypothetical protein
MAFPLQHTVFTNQEEIIEYIIIEILRQRLHGSVNKINKYFNSIYAKLGENILLGHAHGYNLCEHTHGLLVSLSNPPNYHKSP